MTEPSAPRPVPGPVTPRPDRPADGAAADRFAGLDDRPVAEHVEVFEDEHARLQRRLGTIDQI